MTSYGKKCKEDNDCYSKICEMTYKNKKPDTRRCVVKNNIDKIDENDSKKVLEFGKECNTDSDCKSNICEHKYTVNTSGERVDNGTLCVIQEPKYGKQCSSNSDCESFRCKIIYDKNNIPTSRKCVIFKNQPEIENESRSFGDIDDDHLPDYAKSGAWKQAKNEKVYLDDKEKAKKLQGRGIIADIIIIFMEYIVIFIKTAIKILILGWKLIFFVISFIPSLILKIRM